MRTRSRRRARRGRCRALGDHGAARLDRIGVRFEPMYRARSSADRCPRARIAWRAASKEMVIVSSSMPGTVFSTAAALASPLRGDVRRADRGSAAHRLRSRRSRTRRFLQSQVARRAFFEATDDEVGRPRSGRGPCAGPEPRPRASPRPARPPRRGANPRRPRSVDGSACSSRAVTKKMSGAGLPRLTRGDRRHKPPCRRWRTRSDAAGS